MKLRMILGLMVAIYASFSNADCDVIDKGNLTLVNPTVVTFSANNYGYDLMTISSGAQIETRKVYAHINFWFDAGPSLLNYVAGKAKSEGKMMFFDGNSYTHNFGIAGENISDCSGN